MSFIAKKKQALLVPSGPDFHLFVILTDTCQHNMHLMVPICSIHPPRYYDPTCVIKPAENVHPFIKQDSYVYYSQIQERNKEHIAGCVANNSFIEKAPALSEAALQRICNGILTSPHTKGWAKKQFSEWPK